MMKILFQTTNPRSASFQFYAESLRKINDSPSFGAEVIVEERAGRCEFDQFDIALFMGGSNRSREAKDQRADVICGVVEPRSAQKNDFSGVDIVVVNGLEAMDFFSDCCENLFVYHVYPTVSRASPAFQKNEALTLGYHGNKLHLEAMVPRITDAIRQVHEMIPVKLYAMYNVRELGQSKIVTSRYLGFPVTHIDYSRENYARYLAHVDVGLVPHLIPTRKSRLLRYFLGTLNKRYNEKHDDFLLRFKETTNLGRHFVFAQYGIPIISDMAPSACSFIKHGYSGYLAYSTGGWFSALRSCASDASLRKDIGERLKLEWETNYAHHLLNNRLLAELKRLKNAKCKSG